MTIQRMEHVGIVVDDLAAATSFFVDLGLTLQGEGPIEDEIVDRVVAIAGVRADVAILQSPDGHGGLELIKFQSPPSLDGDSNAPPNTLGIRHVTFVVDDIHAAVTDLQSRGTDLVGAVERYQDSFWLCYVRGPEGILVELMEQIA
jgi:catechol 2,3-dioxygenase-like lactoylglutathione lyase family enzyme